MKRILLLGPALLLAAAPAHATGGFECWTPDRGIVLIGSFGNSVGMPMERTLRTSGEDAQIVIMRQWIGEGEVRVDLAARNEERLEARLRARLEAEGTGSGTLERDGATHRVRCEMERMDE
jgi:hypothetical protein